VTAPAAAAAATAAVPVPGQPSGSGGHKESTVNYELDKTIKHTKQPVGSIKRLSVAVVVNYKKTTEKDGKVSAKPLSQAEMAQITNLVKEAMGYRQDRGDTLNVVNCGAVMERPRRDCYRQGNWPEFADCCRGIFSGVQGIATLAQGTFDAAASAAGTGRDTRGHALADRSGEL
jgi:hypothetical protein